MVTSSSRAMQSSLMVLLLLSAVVASQAHPVSCKNTCEKAMFFNGIWTDVGETTVLEVKNVIVVEVDDGEGVKHVVEFKCPEHVQALEFVYHGVGFVKAQIPDVSGLGPKLHSGRRSLREADLSGGTVDLGSKHRSLLPGGLLDGGGGIDGVDSILGGLLGPNAVVGSGGIRRGSDLDVDAGLIYVGGGD